MCESANPSIRPPKNRKPASSMLRRGVMGTGTLFWSNKTAEVKHGSKFHHFSGVQIGWMFFFQEIIGLRVSNWIPFPQF